VTSFARVAFPAMGSTCEIKAFDAGDELMEWARHRVGQLEACWSRFRPASEICQLNALAGTPVTVSRDTYLLVEHAVAAWRLTGGLFDPTVLRAVASFGYDRTFSSMQVPTRPPNCSPPPGCRDIVLYPLELTVALPAGVAIDPGGLGKGLCADLVAEELIAAGASGACVDMGGDVRVTGRCDAVPAWRCGIADPYGDDALVAVVDLAEGGIGTSSRLVRRWCIAGVEYHHLVDPRSGRPADRGVSAVSVIAGQTWWAEVVAKAAFVVGRDAAAGVIERLGGQGLVVGGRGDASVTAGFGSFVAESPRAECPRWG